MPLSEKKNSIPQSRSAMNLPIGYRFLPTDEELIVHYLKRKVYSQPLSYNNIPTVNLYQYTPENLCDVLGGDDEEKEWYLFSPRKRISSGGTRVDRTTPYRYWKASTVDKPIKHNGEVVGYRNTLVYCKCKSPAGTVKKTNWIMHEYRLKDLPKLVDAAENINRLLDEIVLCRIHNHNKNYRRNCNGARYTQYQRNQSIPTIEEANQQQIFSSAPETSHYANPLPQNSFDGIDEPSTDKDIEFLYDIMNM
ncbi:NAC domain-containing protein 96 [Sesamum angolense]|uniref:NAC domain-containing protein 96 n=1 Tax=Sesamum angolense TaxID=2727404 RepID=A0AAE1WGI6_9LAMI|nr:NAC domain-containing protein 96 [Sesamum angolense]